MSKGKKGTLIASSVLVIIGSIIAIALAGLLIWLGTVISEEVILDFFRSSETFVIQENKNGFEYIITNLETNDFFSSTDVCNIVNLFMLVFMISGFVILGIEIIKMILAIVSLIKCRKKYPTGTVSALLVLSILTGSLLVAILLIISLCIKNKKQSTDLLQQKV